MLTFVSATRFAREEFEASSLLALSLKSVKQVTHVQMRLYERNSQPLGACYNDALTQAADDDVLVFVHDDVRIDDWMLGWRLQEALMHFDVVGVAGNRRRQPHQQTWYLQPPGEDWAGQVGQLPWDRWQLSGAVMHLHGDRSVLSNFGPVPARVALLDGVLLAARAGTLRQAGVRFDPALGFHFYDLDFCRAASAAGLKLGTWPLAITHASAGASVHSVAWARSRRIYFAKHGD